MVMETSEHGLIYHGHDDARSRGDCTTLVQRFQRKPKRFKKDGTPYKPRKGWGPYRSVPNERAAAFNLQLDIQSLQQQIRDLRQLRDVLRTKTLVQRHSPEGSLMQVVREFFRVFRSGPVSNNPGKKLSMTAEQQCDFLYGIVDAEVDVGNGLRGPDIMMYQLDMYSTLLRWIRLEMHSFDIVESEDSVVIHTSAMLRFQVTNETITSVFPHVVGEDWLVSQLVGKEVEASIGMVFYFNAEGKCCKMDADTDFVGAFASILKELSTVEMLLSRALIAENSMLGVGESLDLHLKDGQPSVLQEAEGCTTMSPGDENGTGEAPAHVAPIQWSENPAFNDVGTSCVHIVKDYYLAFADGFLSDNDTALAAVFQRDFLLHRFAGTASPGSQASPTRTAERWTALSQCFSMRGFHQTAVSSVEIHHLVGTCAIESSAVYNLCIMPTTIRSVFPHIAAHAKLCGALIGQVLTVPSQIYFAVEIATGRICRIEERMDFEVAMAKLVDSAHELKFVLSDAKLVLDGVDYRRIFGS